MGSSIQFSCQNCEYDKTFMLGVGMMYSALENVLDSSVRSKIQRQRIRDILEHHAVSDVKFEQAVYQCGHCDELAERFFVSILYDQGSGYEITYRCPKCRRLLRYIEDPEEYNGPCPLCHEKSLLVSDGGIMWD